MKRVAIWTGIILFVLMNCFILFTAFHAAFIGR